MDTSLFDYTLPQELIAQHRAEPRDSSRLFYIDASRDPPVHQHLHFRDVESKMAPGDVLVLNRTRVIPARLPATKPTGAKGEVLLLNAIAPGSWEALLKFRVPRKGLCLLTPDPAVSVQVEEVLEEGRCSVSLSRGGHPLDQKEVLDWIREHGVMPTPPYIKRVVGRTEEYQTVYGDVEGSIAAPTAGLHFTTGLLERLERKGVEIAYIILHVGIGTFTPVKARTLEAHNMAKEKFTVPPQAVETIKRAVDRSRETDRTHLWAVGTTVMRTLESAFDRKGSCIRYEGATDLFIMPGHDFILPYKGFITNFHLPRSTPLALVSAFYDRERILKAYGEAVKEGYRFYSFGDSMMIRRGR